MNYDDKFFADLDTDCEIDRVRLEKEWTLQPSKYLKYAMASAFFQKQAAEEAEHVKVVEATLQADAAEDPDKCLGAGVKATVDRCAGYATTHPERQAAKQRAIDAKYRADMAQAAVFAMQNRKEALENLVKLQSMELYSEPKTTDRDFVTRSTQRAATDAIKNSGVLRRRS